MRSSKAVTTHQEEYSLINERVVRCFLAFNSGAPHNLYMSPLILLRDTAYVKGATMKLNNKLLIIIGLSWITFISVAIFKPIHASLINFISLGILVAVICYELLRIFLVRRVERLHRDVKNLTTHVLINKDNEQPLLQITGRDEVAEIANEINQLLNTERENQLHYTEKLTQQALELQKNKTQLQQESVQRRTLERKLAGNYALKKLPQYDGLTTLPNRIFFNEVLNKSINHAQRHQQILAILLIDLTLVVPLEFITDAKKYDLILQAMSKRLKQTLREEDILAKLEENEFSILLSDIGQPKFASTVADKILRALSLPLQISNEEYIFAANIGISIYPDDGKSLEELLQHADIALHNAKQAGHNVYQFYIPELDAQARRYIELGINLRKALCNNELVLYYQPKLNIKKGNIVGVETLLRWEHPEFGLIYPDQFIAVAEETGLIMQIGEYILREACRMTKFWHDSGYEHITVAVNLSPVQFHHPDICKMISQALTAADLNPQYLEIEITEKVAMNHVDESRKILNAMKALGVQLSIDHFGTGYTSISYLKEFPISTLKIDHNFIKGIPHNPNDIAIISAFISLAHNLGLEVVAEGVETTPQIEFLSTQQCDAIQGYFISYPLPAQKVAQQFTKLKYEILS